MRGLKLPCKSSLANSTSPGKTRRPTTSACAQLLADAAIEPGALVVLPEMFATGFSMHVDTIAEARRRTDARVSGRAGPGASNAVVLGGRRDPRGRRPRPQRGGGLRSRGQELARYCKLHPFSFAGETKHYEAGDGYRPLSTGTISRRPAGLLRPALSRGVSPARCARAPN